MMAILVGTTAGAPAGFAAGAALPAGGGAAVWAEAKTARLSTKTEKATFLFKRKTPKCEDTTILSENWRNSAPQLTIALSSECSTDGEPEQGTPLKVRIKARLVVADVAVVRGLIGEHGPIRDNGGL
jgi:hypothetical protein